MHCTRRDHRVQSAECSTTRVPRRPSINNTVLSISIKFDMCVRWSLSILIDRLLYSACAYLWIPYLWIIGHAHCLSASRIRPSAVVQSGPQTYWQAEMPFLSLLRWTYSEHTVLYGTVGAHRAAAPSRP